MAHKWGVGILFLCFGLLQSIPSYAQVRDLPGIDIVSREEWGATESWTRLDGGSWNGFRLFLTNYNDWLIAGGDDPAGKFTARKTRKELETKRRAFLKTNYPSDVSVDETVEFVDNYELVRPRQYHENKTKIVIHHTAGSQVYDTPAAALSGVRDIFKFHTLSREWGDVGYNFLIDPYGTIYEGRAGGRGVIGGHTDWNNVSTIGIALMGNFEIDKPTDAAWESLLHLTTVLALEYNIDPYDYTSRYATTHEAPRLSVHGADSLIGHLDAKVTACPGEYVYERLPELKQQVTTLVKLIRSSENSQWSQIDFIDAPPAAYFSETKGVLKVVMPHGGKVSCESMSDRLVVTDCLWGSNDTLKVYVAHDGFPASGKKSIMVTIGNNYYMVSPTIVWEKDLDLLRQRKMQKYEEDHGKIQSSKTLEKVIKNIPFSSVEKLTRKDVKVFLYDASTTLSTWEWSCSDGCDVVTDDATIYDVDEVKAIQFDGVLRVFADGQALETETVKLENDNFIVLENYGRTFSDLPMNIFKGDIVLSKQRFKHLDHGRIETYTLVNELPLDDYLKGVGEISEKQHIEKLKTMSLLTKGYMLFYLDGANEHPAIPQDASYNAIDDPRLFQKYLGASFEVYGNRRLEALEATEDEYVTYEDNLPILPYFHCSAGFTKSARDYFGRTDTPWLQSELDVAICASGLFEGHGVGLSGDGAEAMARKGLGYEEIIKRYYRGIEIEKE